MLQLAPTLSTYVLWIYPCAMECEEVSFSEFTQTGVRVLLSVTLSTTLHPAIPAVYSYSSVPDNLSVQAIVFNAAPNDTVLLQH